MAKLSGVDTSQACNLIFEIGSLIDGVKPKCKTRDLWCQSSRSFNQVPLLDTLEHRASAKARLSRNDAFATNGAFIREHRD